MNSDMTVHTVVTLQIRPVSDLVPHMEVVQIGIEKIRFHMICSVRNVMGKTDMCHMWAKKIRFGPHLPAITEMAMLYQRCCACKIAV